MKTIVESRSVGKVVLRCLVVMLGVTTAAHAHADVIITDFTAPTSTDGISNINTFGGLWLWTSYSGTNPNGTRILTVQSNSPNNYLAEENMPRIPITGGTDLRITGDWSQVDSNGHFKIDLSNSGGLVATGSFTYGQFAGGLKSVSTPLTWNPSRVSDEVDQWYLVGDGANNITYYGDLRLTQMAVAVPEPTTYAMALAGGACGGFSMWRRRERVRCDCSDWND